jgi:hypothetical protein
MPTNSNAQFHIMETSRAARAAFARLMREHREGDPSIVLRVYYAPMRLETYAEGEVPDGYRLAWPEPVPTDRTEDQICQWFAARSGSVPYLTDGPTPDPTPRAPGGSSKGTPLRDASDNTVSALSIVRDGLNRRERLAIAAREPAAMAGLDSFDADTRHEICRLCDEFKAKINHKATSRAIRGAHRSGSK